MIVKNVVIIIYVWCCVLCSINTIAQSTRNIGFRLPMDLPLNLAGSFGEPRKDHFHSGIDIKTNGKEGQPVFSIGDGYISRIKVSPYGYGKAIYITHKNGYTSVYAHLNKFFGAIESYIQQQHYLLKKSELDIYLAATKFPVTKNDTIAFSGNTGGSSAPHLHFEIRDTKTEHALNPLDFYPKEFYVDTIPPTIDAIFICDYNTSFYYNSSCEVLYRIPDTIYNNLLSIKVESNNFYIKLDGFDKQNSSKSKNGIYMIKVSNNRNKIWFQYKMDEIDFDKTRMCNAFVDYYAISMLDFSYYNCFKFPKNTLSIYSNLTDNGVINLDEVDNDTIYIDCYDYNLNQTTIKIKFIHTDNTSPNYKFYAKDIPVIIDNPSPDYFNLQADVSSFYDDVRLKIQYEKMNKEELSNKAITQKIHNIPLHKSAKISFTSSIKKNRNKVVIVLQDNKGKESALKTTFDKTKFYAETKELGTFYLKYDTTKPEIKILNLKSESININISDKLSGIGSYNVYIDNKWTNFYYDAKNDILEYNYDKTLTTGKHNLKIIVTDNVGNKNTLTHNFTY